MWVSETDRELLAEIEGGLPLVRDPYAEIGRRIGLSEADVIDRLRALVDRGVIKRFGLVVRHRELGYLANAMVVWDVPDDLVQTIGQRAGTYPFVTLCYRRPRRLPRWPYNLFCMIHGRDRITVREQIARLNAETGLDDYDHAVLFSRRRFKQCGAQYGIRTAPEAA